MSRGDSLRVMCSNLGIVYTKFAQMLVMHTVPKMFTEEDRLDLLGIVDNCKPIKFKSILSVAERSYGCKLKDKGIKLYRNPVGVASVPQVHRGRLDTGEDIVLKIKRPDITCNIEIDIAILSFLVKYFVWVFMFSNPSGCKRALLDFGEWTRED